MKWSATVLEPVAVAERPGNATAPTGVRNLFETLLRHWVQQERWQLHSVLFLCVWLLATATVVAWIEPLPQAKFGHDTTGFLDGAWRVWSGQRPHVDFFSSLGPITYLIFAAGLAWGKLDPAGVGPVMAFCGLLLGVWAYMISRVRLLPPVAALFAVFVALLGTAPYALSFEPWQPTYAMIYNRLGYSLLAIVIIEGFAPLFVKKQTKSQRLIGGLSSGLALGIVFFLKISYFGIGLGLFAVSLTITSRNRERLAGMITGFTVVFLVMFAYLRFDVAAFLADMHATAKARSSGLFVRRLRVILNAELPYLLGIAALLAAEFSKSSKSNRAAVRCLIMAVAISVADLALCGTNQQLPYFPLTVVAALLLVNEATLYARRLTESDLRLSALLLSVVIGWGIIRSVSYLGADTEGLIFAATTAASRGELQNAATIDAPHMRDLVFLPTDDHLRGSNGPLYTHFVNQGLGLLRKYSGPHDSVVTLGYSNPFSYALLRPPAHGGSPFWAEDSNYSEQSLPSTDKLIGDAAVVMIPMDKDHPGKAEAPMLEKACMPILKKNFRLAAETDMWRMYVRASSPRAAS